MLNAAKDLLSPSRRSDVPPFIVMDVMAAAAAREARGERVVHMEVGQPAAPTAMAATTATPRMTGERRRPNAAIPVVFIPGCARRGSART